MQNEFHDKSLERLEVDTSYLGGFDVAVVRAFRKRMQFIRAAQDERDLNAWRALRFEKLKGKRQHQHSLRLNAQWRLIVEFHGVARDKVIRIIAIEDYHR